jgi:hypothetical protein
MRCPNCNLEQPDQNTECPKCGIIFEKFNKQQRSPRINRKRILRATGNGKEVGRFVKKLFLEVNRETNPFYFGGRVLLFLLLFIWGWKFILTPMETNYAGNSFLHYINLPFHEAGHIFFQIFGRWMTSLGGTLGQLLVPFVCLLALLIKSRDPFGASATLWWLGESFMDIAPYINDARSGKLMLLGGVTGKEADYGYHDWEFILSEVGLLRFDHFLARLAEGVGIILMITSFAWAGTVLFRQYRTLKWTPEI